MVCNHRSESAGSPLGITIRDLDIRPGDSVAGTARATAAPTTDHASILSATGAGGGSAGKRQRDSTRQTCRRLSLCGRAARRRCRSIESPGLGRRYRSNCPLSDRKRASMGRAGQRKQSGRHWILWLSCRRSVTRSGRAPRQRALVLHARRMQHAQQRDQCHGDSAIADACHGRNHFVRRQATIDAAEASRRPSRRRETAAAVTPIHE
jgi:hypothetical protein